MLLRNPESKSNRHPVPRRARMLLAAMLALGAGASTPTAVLAAAGDNDSSVDARLVGYGTGKKVALEKSSSTPAMLLFLFLVVVGCVPLFKNAKRD